MFVYHISPISLVGVGQRRLRDPPNSVNPRCCPGLMGLHLTKTWCVPPFAPSPPSPERLISHQFTALMGVVLTEHAFCNKVADQW